jgi:integrase
MASISRDPGRRKRIQFTGADGQRHTVRLGKMSVKTAHNLCLRIESLNSAAVSKMPWDGETAAWVGELEAMPMLYNRLAMVGLVPPREPKAGSKAPKLGAFLDQYVDGRTDIKPRTKSNLKQARDNLVRFFGADKPLRDITAGCADEYRLHLLSRLSENTARRHCGRAKQFFRAALRKRLVQENPFGDMKGCQVKGNAARFYFITRNEAGKVLEACPDAEWRLIFALSRYGGLRCPSETLGLRLSDVDWERSRITVHSPKTEHHEGRESRQVPIFPELRPYLDQVWHHAKPGTEFLITRYRDGGVNLRTQLQRIIGRAGLKAWPKLFQNLRSTRETELNETYPIHVVCAWLGNSPTVANRHYLQVRDEDFERAATGGAESGAAGIIPPARKQAQSLSAPRRHNTHNTPPEQDLVPVVASSGYCLETCTAPRAGLEPATFGLEV